jgi:hypothetical protein
MSQSAKADFFEKLKRGKPVEKLPVSLNPVFHRLDASDFRVHLGPKTRSLFQDIPHQLSEEETLKRTVSSIPREILDSIVLSAIETGVPVTAAAVHQTFNDLLNQGVLRLPVEVGLRLVGQGAL